MSAKVWIRCFVVSLIACALVPPLTMTAMAPDEGQEVVDLRTIDRDKLSKLSEAELSKYLESVPMRRVSGLERFTYWFTDPHWLHGWWPAVTVWFLFFFAATVCVSFLNGRDKRGT